MRASGEAKSSLSDTEKPTGAQSRSDPARMLQGRRIPSRSGEQLLACRIAANHLEGAGRMRWQLSCVTM